MASSCAPHRNRQIGLTLFLVQGNKKTGHTEKFIEKYSGIRLFENKLFDNTVESRQKLEFRFKVRIGQETHIHDNIRFKRHTIPESKRLNMDVENLGCTFAGNDADN